MQVFTSKWDGNCNSVWDSYYNGTASFGSDFGHGLETSGSTDVFVTGEAQNSGTGQDYVTLKYDGSNGNQLWATLYNGPGNGLDIARAMVVDSSGNPIVTGESTNAAGYRNFATVKYDGSSGNQLWVARYDGSGTGHDAAYAIALDSSGNPIVTGMIIGAGASEDYATVKYDGSNGNQLWAATYAGPGDTDIAHAMVVDSSGNVYVTGESDNASGNRDFATVKYDSNGNQQWVARYNGPGNGSDVARFIALDPNGKVYVAGDSTGSGTGKDVFIIRYAADGTQEGEVRKDGSANNDDQTGDIALDDAGNVFVTAFLCDTTSGGSCTQGNIHLIKYGNTYPGTNVQINTGTQNVALTLPTVTAAGGTTVATSSTGTAVPTGYSFGSPARYFDIATTATFTGNAQVCITYDETRFSDESALRLFRHNGSTWVDVTSSLNTTTNVLCGQTASFSEFGIGETSSGGTPTTRVQLASLTTHPSDGQVLISWSTGAEIDNAGFNILRASDSAGPYVRISPSLIPARGIAPAGAAYTFVDATVTNDRTYYYRVEDVDNRGLRTTHRISSARPMVAEVPKSNQEAPVAVAMIPEGVALPAANREVAYQIDEVFYYELLKESETSQSAPLPEGTISEEVISFRAYSLDGRIVLSWTVDSSEDRYVLLRGESENGPYLAVTKEALTSEDANELTYSDATVQNGVTYYYRLERITPDGTHALIGPIPATPKVVVGQSVVK